MGTEKKRPQDRWNEKAGLISKSYKLKRELTEEFAEACDSAGVSQAGQISKMMKAFITEVQAQAQKNLLNGKSWMLVFNMINIRLFSI